MCSVKMKMLRRNYDVKNGYKLSINNVEFFYSPPRLRVLIHYLCSIAVWSASPQTTLGRPWPRADIRTWDGRSRGRDSITTRPPHLLIRIKNNFIKTMHGLQPNFDQERQPSITVLHGYKLYVNLFSTSIDSTFYRFVDNKCTIVQKRKRILN